LVFQGRLDEAQIEIASFRDRHPHAKGTSRTQRSFRRSCKGRRHVQERAFVQPRRAVDNIWR
jgi:hypothetical protein